MKNSCNWFRNVVRHYISPHDNSLCGCGRWCFHHTIWFGFLIREFQDISERSWGVLVVCKVCPSPNTSLLTMEERWNPGQWNLIMRWAGLSNHTGIKAFGGLCTKNVAAAKPEMEKRADAADASVLFFSLAVLICWLYTRKLAKKRAVLFAVCYKYYEISTVL